MRCISLFLSSSPDRELRATLGASSSGSVGAPTLSKEYYYALISLLVYLQRIEYLFKSKTNSPYRRLYTLRYSCGGLVGLTDCLSSAGSRLARLLFKLI